MMKLLLILMCTAALTACAAMAKQNIPVAAFAAPSQVGKNEKAHANEYGGPQGRCFWVNDNCYGEPYEQPRPDEYHEPGKLPPKHFEHGGPHFKPPHHGGDLGRRMPR